ncbi:nitrous oxide reductase accessory protein NosL [Halorussus lipolyticus]|uniref:nitrous oxide reductase accessory protein NosL n=1 Tax=Halorussus lipolyticus TaxID=3034024 RepID=UPI0023E8CA83|nr:nitrous oxide reductase accessory protein NosL [Halorussus sp. DT80]
MDSRDGGGPRRHHTLDHGHDCGDSHGEDGTHTDGTDQRRRSVLRASALGVTASLAGCLGGLTGDGGQAPAAVPLAGDLACDVCGMVIGKHPGPNGQIFYGDNSPEGHDNPARFDSLKRCFFPYKLEHEQMGWNIDAAYVTDYSSVEYDVSTQGSATTISSFTDPESFARAEDLNYVVDSEVEGAMGPDFVPFSNDEDAASFADEYGGEVVEYGDIGEALVGK